MADITKTRTQLVQRLWEKTVGEAGQTAPSEQTTFIDGKVDACIDALNEEGTIYIGDIEAIPVAVFEDLCELIVARFLATDYKKPKDWAAVKEGENTLRRMTAAKPTYQVLKSTYY
jgi:hypothetical protein